MAEAVAHPEAPLGRSDPTRRWAVRTDDGAVAFPGLTTVEADRVGDVLDSAGAAARARMLVPVTLPVVLSDGAGPYLLAHDGTLVLVLGAHPHVDGLALAMGTPNPGVRWVAGVRRVDDGAAWSVVASAEMPEAEAVAALDGLADAAGDMGVAAWAARWRAGRPTPDGNP